jgi:hypothetical protein
MAGRRSDCGAVYAPLNVVDRFISESDLITVRPIELVRAVRTPTEPPLAKRSGRDASRVAADVDSRITNADDVSYPNSLVLGRVEGLTARTRRGTVDQLAVVDFAETFECRTDRADDLVLQPLDRAQFVGVLPLEV